MSMNDPLRAALELYRQRRASILEELRKVDLTIRQLESDVGEVSEDRPENYGALPLESVVERPSVSAGKGPSVRQDEFFGMTQSDAAKAYLAKVGHAVSMDQLVSNLRAGGCKVGAANAKHSLYVSLVRNTREFVPVGNGFLGLRSFYPGLKTTSSKGGEKRKKVKARRKTKKLLPKKKAQTQKSAPEETLAHKTVYAVLRDGGSHSRDAILKVGKDAGVMPIAIHGILRNAKDIETVGDQVRLKKATGSNVEEVRTG